MVGARCSGLPFRPRRRRRLGAAEWTSAAVGVAVLVTVLLVRRRWPAVPGALLALAVSAPFHCALMKPAEDRLAPDLRAVPVANPAVPVVANVDAEVKRTGAEAVDALVRQVSSPVRWEDVMRRLASEGVRKYVEVGPGAVLTGLGRKILPDAAFTSIEDPSGIDAVAALFA